MSDSQVEEIKSKIDIIEIIQSYLPIKKKGKNFWANCPFHGEKTPSFSVSPDLQIFKCFGCGKSGDVFTFVEDYEKIDFREALEMLAKKAGIVLKANPSLTSEEKINQKILLINQYCAVFYHHVLTKHPLGKPALDYLFNRGIKLETINLFKIGFSPSQPKHLLSFLKTKGFTVTDVLNTGTFGQKNNYTYDRFRNRLIFPLFDHRDRIVAFSGRVLPNDPNPNMGKYINSPETPVYHKSQMFFGLNLTKNSIRTLDEAIVVEGEFDLISPYQAGYQNIVALKGTAFTQDQLSLLKRYTSNLLLALDSDFAGVSASRKSILLADSLGFNLKALDLKKYKDPDEAVKNDPIFFAKQLKNAVSIWDYIINTALNTYDSSTDVGKKQILEFVFPFLTNIDNAVIKSSYFTKLSNLLNVDQKALQDESLKFTRSLETTQKTNIVIPKTSNDNNPLRTEKLQKLIITLIFSQTNPVQFYKKYESYLDIITLPQFTKILSFLKSYNHKTFSASVFIKNLPAETTSLFQDIFIQSQNEIQDPIWTGKKVIKLAADIKLIDLKSQQRQLTLKIARAEQAHQISLVKKLERKYNQVLNQISKLQSGL